MTRVIVNDASCLIDLHKGCLLHLLCKLPYEMVVPLPIRETEILGFTSQEWAMLDDNGLVTHDLPPDEVGEAFIIKQLHSRLSVNDCFCIVTAHHFEDAVLLTGDRSLKNVAHDRGLEVHGILWITEQFRLLGLCQNRLLCATLNIWRNDKSVFVPNKLIEEQMRILECII